MKQLKCEICGGTDIKKIEEGVFCCDSCGCKYTVEQAKSLLTEITGTVKIDGPVQVEGIQTVELILKNAETFVTLGDYEKAKRLYQELIDKYPQDYRGWWGIIQSGTRDFSLLSTSTRDVSGEYSAIYRNMLQVAKGEENLDNIT